MELPTRQRAASSILDSAILAGDPEEPDKTRPARNDPQADDVRGGDRRRAHRDYLRSRSGHRRGTSLTRQMPVPNVSIFVLIAAAVSVRKLLETRAIRKRRTRSATSTPYGGESWHARPLAAYTRAGICQSAPPPSVTAFGAHCLDRLWICVSVNRTTFSAAEGSARTHELGNAFVTDCASGARSFHLRTSRGPPMPAQNAGRWKERANQVRLIAESMGHDPVRALLLEIAAQYEAAAMDDAAALKAEAPSAPSGASAETVRVRSLGERCGRWRCAPHH
jgi:hypothetical protein